MKTCPYVCDNKSLHGYCMSTACINPLYNRITINQWMEKADYVQVVRCKDCRNFQPCKGKRAKVNTDKSGWCDTNEYYVRAYDYCSYGERRSE